MIYYSVGDNRRLWFVIQMAILAFLVANIAPVLDPFLPDFLDFGTDSIALRGSSLGFVGILLFVFNKWLWRFPLIRQLTGIPDMNGTWIGTLDRKQYPDLEAEKGLPIIIHIRQEWLRMSYVLEAMVDDSLSAATRSESKSISIIGSKIEGYDIIETFEFSEAYGVSMMRLNPETGESQLTGTYVSSVPRIGQLNIAKLEHPTGFQRSAIKKLKSKQDESYLAITINRGLITDEKKKLSRRVSQSVYSDLMSDRVERDGDSFHMTIVAPHEYDILSPQQQEYLEGKLVGFGLVGLGKIERKDAQTWYILARSPHADFLRQKVGLPKKDFHITLGFTPHDIHDHPKDITTLVD